MDEGKKAYNQYMAEYMKEYRKKNPEKMKKINRDFWKRKALKNKEVANAEKI